MSQTQIIFQLAPVLPIITKKRFLEEVERESTWLRTRIDKGEIPIITLGGTDYVNVALMWKEALERPY